MITTTELMKMHTIYDNTPWFHPMSIKFLSILLKPNWVIFETGCGSSTLWFSDRVKKVVSFEHSKLWYIKVKKIIEDKNIRNIDLRLNPDYPEKGINGFKNDEFDLISIDGRGRVRSIETVIPFLKSDGYLLLDDSERIRYKRVFELLAEWEIKIFGKNEKSDQTSIWRKEIKK